MIWDDALEIDARGFEKSFPKLAAQNLVIIVNNGWEKPWSFTTCVMKVSATSGL